MTRIILAAVLTFCGAVLVPVLLTAQLPIPAGPPVDSALRFEVASIKPYDGTGPTRVRMQPSGGFDVTGGSARMLLQNAFRVRGDQLIGLPDWADDTRYSVVAKAPAGASVIAIPTMLTNLLADRFNLVMHREIRETQSFNLVLAREDGRLGPAMRPTSAACQAMIATQAPATAEPARADPDQAPCGAMQVGAGVARGAGVPLARLVQVLSQLTQRPVNDGTGLSGLYDFTLKFDPNVKGDAVGHSDVPHLFTALPEQLGLRLSSQRGSVQVVVVDRIEKPTVD